MNAGGGAHDREAGSFGFAESTELHGAWFNDHQIMIEVTVRDATAGDERLAAEVDRLCTADLRKIYRPTEEAIRHRATLNANVRRLVAVARGRVVGVVQYYILDERVLIMGLGVHPECRRQGVARALIDHLDRVAESHMCGHLTLRTVRETGNVALFERLGFSVDSEERTSFFESDSRSALTEVTMSKRANTGIGAETDSATPPDTAMEPTAQLRK